MSAIGLLPRPRAKLLISCHADYRREHFIFPRTQSTAMRELVWEKPTKPLQSWDRLFYRAAGMAALLCGAVALLH